MELNRDWLPLQRKLMRDVTRFFDDAPQVGININRYALVDAAQVPELRSAAFLARPFHHVSLFSLTQENGIARYGPLLIPVDAGPGSDVVRRVVRAMRHGWTVSWLSSPLAMDDLADHLAGHLNGELADGKDVLVRYYDPRLLAAFIAHLDEQTKTALLGPVCQWAWWDRHLSLVTVKGGNESKSACITQTNISAVTQKAMAAAAKNDLFNSALLEDSEPDEFSSWLPHTLYHAVSRQVVRAEKLGLKEPADLVLFISLALRVHPDFFDALPNFARKKHSLALGEIDMATLALGVVDDDWNLLGRTGPAAVEEVRRVVNDALQLNE